MSKITLDDIKLALEVEGWEVKSPTYKNLATEMEFVCNEGHTVYAPWKKIRTKRECPVCQQNSFCI